MTENEEDEIIWIASIDIGKINFSFYVEEINLSELKSIENISKENRYNPNGTYKPEFAKLMEKIYKNGKKIFGSLSNENDDDFEKKPSNSFLFSECKEWS